MQLYQAGILFEQHGIFSLPASILHSMLPLGPLFVLSLNGVLAQGAQPRQIEYVQKELRLPMRDGTRLHTVLLLPKKQGKGPILLERTPYSAGNYGRKTLTLNDSDPLVKAGFIFAYQDVRGRFLSEGEFSELRPVNQNPRPKDCDETTDTWDTIEQLSKLPESNGKVGITGISYPGGYAALGSIRSHPALKASSPQAPTANWWIGDDDHHNGALFLQSAFEYITWFGEKNSGPPDFYKDTFEVSYKGDAYRFFLELGALKNANERFFKGRSRYWNDLMRHPDYDEFWQSRAVPEQMKGVKSPMLTVGGWFDAEDLYGALNIHAFAERQNPQTPTHLVMGPWAHGQWAGEGSSLGPVHFGRDTSAWYRRHIEAPFWLHHLAGGPAPNIRKATVFETGRNRWHGFDSWPPKGAKPFVAALGKESLHLGSKPSEEASQVTYLADPSNPVPYHKQPQTDRTATFMVDDQRFLMGRKDVAFWQTPPLAAPVTLAGPLTAHLKASTTGTDSDFVVKVIDVLPDGTQRLIRAEILRGRYRHSFTTPRPFVPGAAEKFDLKLNDLLHTWLKGHRMMVHIQSSWFPLFDRNPNQFVNLAECADADFKKAEVTIHCGAGGSWLSGQMIDLEGSVPSLLQMKP